MLCTLFQAFRRTGFFKLYRLTGRKSSLSIVRKAAHSAGPGARTSEFEKYVCFWGDDDYDNVLIVFHDISDNVIIMGLKRYDCALN